MCLKVNIVLILSAFCDFFAKSAFYFIKKFKEERIMSRKEKNAEVTLIHELEAMEILKGIQIKENRGIIKSFAMKLARLNEKLSDDFLSKFRCLLDEETNSMLQNYQLNRFIVKEIRC